MTEIEKPYQGCLSVSQILYDGNDIIASGYFNTASGKGQIVLNRVRIKNVDIKNGTFGNVVRLYTADTGFIPQAYK